MVYLYIFIVTTFIVINRKKLTVYITIYLIVIQSDIVHVFNLFTCVLYIILTLHCFYFKLQAAKAERNQEARLLLFSINRRFFYISTFL